MDFFRRLTEKPGRPETSVSGMAGRDEASLVDSARRGNKMAFDTLVTRYQMQIRGFLLRRVGAEAVDDLLQDVWLAAWLAIPRFQKRSCFRTYLYSIAVNKCMDHHRSQSRAATASAQLVQGADGADFAEMRSPEELYAAAEQREAIRLLIDALPAAQREVLDLYYYAEMNLPEIARALDRNLNTVKYQFYRAHELVGQGLQKQGGAGVSITGISPVGVERTPRSVTGR